MFTRKHFTKKYFTSKYFPRLNDEDVEGAMSATLAGTSAVTAGITAVGHMSADLSGSATVVGDLEEASAVNDMSADLSGSGDVAAAATAIGSMSATMAGTSTLALTGVTPAVEDDRSGWFGRRRSSAVRAVPVRLRPLEVVAGRVSARTGARPGASAGRLTLSVGATATTAGASASGLPDRLRVALRPARAASGASSRVPASPGLVVGSSRVGASSGARAVVQGSTLAMWVTSVKVSIGPDRLIEDDEELLMLLEVA